LSRLRRVRVLAVGHPWRGDDAAGRLAAPLVRAVLSPAVELVETDGSMVELLDLLRGPDAVLVIDCVRGGGPPGARVRIDAHREAVPHSTSASSHGLGLAEAIALGRALGALPEVLVLHGVEGASFELGQGPGREVAEALPALAAAVAAEAAALAAGAPAPPA
jgi:hydrogenase maturation protease